MSLLAIGGLAGQGARAEFPGLWRGTVENPDDPEQRGRYQVRIDGIHTDSLEASKLPWAESVGFNAHGTCIFANYDRGDRVLLAFEQGERSKPIVLGGLAARSDGVPDLDPDIWGDYADGRRRMRMRSRSGNVVEIVDTDIDSLIRLSVGGAEIVVTRQGGSVEIRARGPCQINAAGVTIDATTVAARASDTALVEAETALALRSAGSVGVRSGASGGVLDLGQEQDTDGTPRRSKAVRLSALTLVLGEKAPTGGRLPTQDVLIGASAGVKAESVRVELAADNEVVITGTTKVKIDGALIEIG